jgi:RimJ/RimL family protein N-acetyltransferase
MRDVYIRPLEEMDAHVSVNWRNNPEIWKFTGSKPDNKVTIDMELAWIKNVITRTNEKRFAICLSENNQYVGNVQLTDIESNQAQFHIFIGESDFWNKGVATKATKLILQFAFETLRLTSIYLFVKKNNKYAIKAYEKNGFKISDLEGDFIKMITLNQ